MFEKYGEVEKCQIMRDPHTKESRGFGFVKMVTSEQAEAAKEGLQGEVIEGRTMSIEKARRARPRTPTPGKYFGPPKRGKLRQFFRMKIKPIICDTDIFLLKTPALALMIADVAVTEAAAAAVIVMTTDTVAMREATTATTSADMRDDMRSVEQATTATTEMSDDMMTVTTQADETMSATMNAASAMTTMLVANATTIRAKSVVTVVTEATDTALVAATAAAVDMTAIDTSAPETAMVVDLVSQPPAVAQLTPTLPHDLRHASRMEVRADTKQCSLIKFANFHRPGIGYALVTPAVF